MMILDIQDFRFCNVDTSTHGELPHCLYHNVHYDMYEYKS